ncbi:Rha family transcriptional regulator [Methylomonas montana]|uniref:Rha family transcriptional regulator n=1 Tax=Methylomonas montana TaxID=3058963 RepID=UPI0026580730|nr:Rha family transcriptional regulator [Methylomonas montana]WKJ91357.1 Rha family transcriptional regulator [Methylomonas montana]
MSTNAKLKLVEVHGQKLTTTSLVIAELFGRPHKSVLRSLDKLKDRLKFVPISYNDAYGREQKMYQLDERSFLIAMPFIGGKKSVDGQVALVDEFIRLKTIINEPGRKSELTAKRNTGSEMTDMLQFVRESAGKETTKGHCIGEHMFCNRALTGKWAAISEADLDVYDTRLLAAIRKRNMLLMTRHPKQADRKKLMDDFVCQYRANHPRLALVA